MKKRILGTVLAAALIVTQAISVFAVGSKTTDVEASNGYVVTAASTQSFSDVTDSKVVEDLLAVNNGTMTLEQIVEAINPELKDQVAGKEMVTPFFDLKPVNGGIKNAEGKYVVDLTVPSLTKAMTDVKILHYSTVRNTFEIITPSNVNYDTKVITAEFDDLSPVAIIANVDSSKAADSSVGTSPKTGVPSTWMIFFGAAVVLAGVSVVSYRKQK